MSGLIFGEGGGGGAYYRNFTKFHYSKNLHIKRTGVWGVQTDLYIGCFLQNQPENVLENLKIQYCIHYQLMKSTCNATF